MVKRRKKHECVHSYVVEESRKGSDQYNSNKRIAKQEKVKPV